MIKREGTTVTNSVNGANTVTLTINASSSKMLVIVGVDCSNASVTQCTPTSANLTFVNIGSATKATAGPVQMWGAITQGSLTGEVITITATPGAFPQMTVFGAVYKGGLPDAAGGVANVADGANTAVGASTTASVVVTPTQSGDLMIAVIGIVGNLTVTPGANQTLVTSLNNPGTASEVAFLEYTSPVVTTATTMSGTFTSATWGMVGCGLKGVQNGVIINRLRPHAFSPGVAR